MRHLARPLLASKSSSMPIVVEQDVSFTCGMLVNETFATMNQPMEGMNLKQDHIPLRVEHLE